MSSIIFRDDDTGIQYAFRLLSDESIEVTCRKQSRIGAPWEPAGSLEKLPEPVRLRFERLLESRRANAEGLITIPQTAPPPREPGR